jgi:hypothetical protein
MVVGAVSPVVLLPEGFAGHPNDEVRAALLHELAHVKRRDYLTNGICQLAVLPVNWHPVAHVVEQRVRRTREMACDEMAAREMQSELGYARCLVTMARGMLSGGLAERPEFVGLFSNNVLEERVMRLMEGKTALSARAKLVRLVSGATAMAAATLMASSFHVVPTMAAESPAVSPVRTAVLRAAVLSSADASVGAPVCIHRLAKPAVAPTAPVAATPVVPATAPVAATARVAVRTVVAPAAVVFATAPYATAVAAPIALQAPPSAPAMTPPSPVGAPASPAPAPAAASATPPAPELAPVTPVAPASPAAPADKEKNKKKSTYVYQMDSDGDEVAIINGKVRALTPEEKEQIEKAMEQFKNGDFAKHMADLHREMADLRFKDTFDSREFREKMEAAQRELSQNAFMNNEELQEKIQAMVKNFDKQNVYIGPCKDGFLKDKDKEKEKAKQKQKEPDTLQHQ